MGQARSRQFGSSRVKSGQVWDTPEQRVDASTSRRYYCTTVLRPASGHRPGRCQARHAPILQIELHLTRPFKPVDAPSAWSSPWNPDKTEFHGRDPLQIIGQNKTILRRSRSVFATLVGNKTGPERVHTYDAGCHAIKESGLNLIWPIVTNQQITTGGELRAIPNVGVNRYHKLGNRDV